MLRGLYTAASGMVTQQRRHEMLTNNLANANTPGFKADQASLRSFPNMLIQEMNGTKKGVPARNTIGTLSTGVYMQDKMPSFTQGDIHDTGVSTDIALLQGIVPINAETGRPGMLLFTIENEQGDVRYSRNGNFTVDGQGFLVTNQGHYVLDQNGERIWVNNDNFMVNGQGVISNENGVIAQLNIAFADNPMNLVKEGNGLFRLEGELGALPTAIGNDNITFQLKQGFIERSNVDLNQTMTEMMTAFRAFEASQKVLQAYDRSLEKAVNEVGRIG